MSRFLAITLASLLVFLANPVPAQTGQVNAEAADLRWISTWDAALEPPRTLDGVGRPQFNHQTLRQIVHVSVGGNRVRVRLSNIYGTAPLVIGEAQVALHDAGPFNISGSNRMLTFKGQAGITLAPGAMAVSDPVNLQVPNLRNLAVSVYLPQFTPAATQHWNARQTNYISVPGNFAAAAAPPGVFSSLCTSGSNPQTCTSSWYFMDGVEVEKRQPAAVVVALGDSITNGALSSGNENRRWPDVLARRLIANGSNLAVVNQGIDGNTLVVGGAGPTAQRRFERDVLRQPGARFAVVLVGINDIRRGASADRLIPAFRALITQARARGLKIYGGTLTPFGGGSEYQEAQRLAVNRWIRNSGEYDAVIDFDAALRDPDRPRRMRPIFDSGDSLHPSDAGYEAMGKAINLILFRNSEPLDDQARNSSFHP